MNTSLSNITLKTQFKVKEHTFGKKEEIGWREWKHAGKSNLNK
jgi:hypothetical protein